MDMDGKILGNRYELVCRVGLGGMAIVYKAKDRMLNRFVAIKILREEFKENEEFIRRFNVESQAAASLSHQNIVQIYDVGEEDGLQYIVMELIEGNTLKNYIKECGGKLSWREAANFTMQICRALEHAHSKHVVHRDIKPQNIIMTEGNKLKVADFGIARAASNTTTVNSMNTAVGSAHYLSPEQARGGYTDSRSDIYSLGVVMYEMFTGRLPFDADSGVSVIAQHLHENPVPPCQINPDIPRGIEAIIMRAMMKEQRLRYKNASDMLEDLIRVYQNPSVKVSSLHAYLPASEGGVKVTPENSGSELHHRRNKSKKKKKRRILPFLITFATAFLIFASLIIYLLFFGTGEEIKVPDLVGLSYEEAANVAKEASSGNVVFEIIKERDEHSSAKKGTIISQDPEGGRSVKSSREIKVVISLGEVALVLDDYTGDEYVTVKKTLSNAGLKVIKKEVPNDTYEEGIIVKQFPAKGSQMTEGDEVTLEVSVGTTNTIVPDVVGKTLEEAKKELEEYELTWNEPIYGQDSKHSKGQVFKQGVSPNVTVPTGTAIDLYVVGDKDNDPSQNGSSNEDKDPPQNNNDDKNPKKTYKLTLGNLPKDKDKVTIRLVLDGQPFYQGDFDTATGKATITFDITKTLSLDVYYDSVYITTKEVKY